MRKLPFLLILLIVIYLSGCSTTQNYKTLSFFFDGVPDPANDSANRVGSMINKTDTVALALRTVSKASPQKGIHPPYQDKQCKSCHDQSTMGKLIKPQPDLCYQCHVNFDTKYKVLHGPVAGGQCTMCHSPHLSVNPDLLARTGQALCLYCHESGTVMETEAHKGIKEANCTECHNPHGGENRSFLR